jgi:large subunit ribosomal protein L21
MFAIVNIQGQQFKVTEKQLLYVNRLDAGEGDKVEFDQVLLVDNEGSCKVGSPTVAGAKITATVKSHDKGDKVIVFKKKRRKGYQKSNGHRQSLTKIEIDGIKA